MPTTTRVSFRGPRVLAIALIAGISTFVPHAPLTAQEQGVRIGLTYAAGTKPGLYVLPMRGPRADSIRAIITRDLDFGDRITVIAPDTGVPVAGKPNYALFQRLGAAAVLELSQNAGGGLHVVLHEVVAQRVMNTMDFALPRAELNGAWRMALHVAADEIERWVTGEAGIAATRIAFSRGGTIWITDSDGENAYAIPGIASGIGPAWHPSGNTLAYTEVAPDGARIMLKDFRAGTVRRFSRMPGTSVSPAFSPDGRTIVYATGVDGVDLVSQPIAANDAPVRVTVGRGSTNAQPTFSPDGRRIAFTSSRSGRNDIYITDSDGANAELLTTTGFGDQWYRADPSWSPDGRYVAFSTQVEGRFQIATIGLRDRGVKQHTVDGVNEDPSWAPDGRHLVFASNRSGTRQLWVLDTESGRTRQLTRGAPARTAAWSPRLAAAQ